MSRKTHWFCWTRFYKTYENLNLRTKKQYYIYHYWKWIKNLRKSFDEFKNDMYVDYIKHIKLYWEKNTSIDRIDNNWDYCKENCRWSTRKEQNRNKCDNILYFIWWKYLCLTDIAIKYNINKATLSQRIEYWHSIKDSINMPINIKCYSRNTKQYHNDIINMANEWLSITAMHNILNISISSIHKYLNKNNIEYSTKSVKSQK